METELTGSWKTRHRVLQDPLPGSWKTLRVSLYSLTLFLLSDIVGGTVMQNRHPVDRLHDVRVELKRLEAEEEKLRAYLLEHPSDRTGEEHIAVVGSQSRKRVDLKALADEISVSIGPTTSLCPL